jgi:hypothetical protein
VSVAGLIVLGACGSSTSVTAGGPATSIATTAPGVSGATSVAATTEAPSKPTIAANGDVTVGESINQQTVTVPLGAVVTVVLHSTYWQIGAPLDTKTLRPEGEPVVDAVLPGQGGCVAGQGCGTVTQRFTTVAKGSSTLSASRTSCGEALACTAQNGNWSMTIIVT